LIDYIEDHFVPPADAASSSMRDFLVYDHPPQPFSPRYFDEGTALFSYDSRQAQIATEIKRADKAASVFAGTALAPVSCDRLKLADLIHFFSNPAKFFLRERLKITPGIKEIDHFADSEPFALDALDTYKFNHDLVSRLLAANSAANDLEAEEGELEKYFVASGTLPPQQSGRVLFAEKLKRARALARQLEPYCDELLPALQQELILNVLGHEIVLDVSISDIFRGRDDMVRQILYRPASDVKPKDKVVTAIMNIALGAIASSAAPAPLETRFHTLKENKNLVLPVGEVESGRFDLETLVELYLEGLSRPLAFLPALSFAWYDTWLKESAKNGEEPAFSAAWEKVRGELMNVRNYEAQDENYHYVFGDHFDDTDFRADFSALARRLGPLFVRAGGK
jgi:exodeoxyribonuclease V gamma subunit